MSHNVTILNAECRMQNAELRVKKWVVEKILSVGVRDDPDYVI